MIYRDKNLQKNTVTLHSYGGGNALDRFGNLDISTDGHGNVNIHPHQGTF